MFSTLFKLQIPEIDTPSAQAKLGQEDKPFLLDVRQPDEYNYGHIPGATLVPLGELRQRVNELPRNREIICVCRSGNRSATATRFLSSAGYKVTNLKGGMIHWLRAGLPVIKGMAK